MGLKATASMDTHANAPDGATAAAVDLGTMPVWNLGDLYPDPKSPEIARDLESAARQAKDLKERYQGKLTGLGLGLMIINRLAGLVLPTTSKYLMDNVVLHNQWDLLPRLALAAAGATAPVKKQAAAE